MILRGGPPFFEGRGHKVFNVQLKKGVVMQTVSRIALISWLSLVSAFSMDNDKGVQEIHSTIDKFYKSCQEEIMRVRQQNEVLDKKLSDEKSKNASLQQQIDQLREESEGEQQRIDIALDQVTKRKDAVIEQKITFIRKLNKEVNKLTSENEALTKQAQEAQRLAKELSRAMQREQVWKAGGEKYKAENSKLEKQIEELKKQNKELLEERDECIRITDENFRIRIQQQEISAMLDHNNKQLEVELEKYRKSDLNEVVGLKDQISIMKSTLDSASSQNKTLEDHIRQQEKDHQDKIEKLKQGHDNEIADLKKKHGDELAKLERDKRTLISQMRSYKQKNITQDDVDNLNMQIDKLKMDNESLTRKLRQVSQDFAEKDILAKEQEQVIHGLRQRNQELMNTIDQLKSQKSTNKWQPKSGRK